MSAPLYAACSPEEGKSAELVADQLQSWPDVHRAYAQYGKCDDGAVAEGFSDSIARLLAVRWESVGVLIRLAHLHPNFGEFVLKHIDSLMSPEQGRKIERNARLRCPNGAESLCRGVAQRARDATHG
jgi:hypothetical protein